MFAIAINTVLSSGDPGTRRITNRLNGFRYWLLETTGLKPGVSQA